MTVFINFFFNPPHALFNHSPQQYIAAFYSNVQCALNICSDPSDLTPELNYVKSLALSQRYIPTIIDKALNKFQKLKHSICHSDLCPNSSHFAFLFWQKFVKSFHNLGSKPPLNLLMKLNYLLL